MALIETEIEFVTRRGNKTEHQAIIHDHGHGTILILPGLNNRSDIPILHLIRKALLDNNFNIINMDFSEVFDNCLKETYLDELELLVVGVMNKYFEKNDNNKNYVIGRSLGSVLATNLIKKGYFDFKKCIFISPIGSTIDNLEGLEHFNGLVFSSLNDQFLNEEMISKLKGLNQYELKIYELGNHSLEVDGDIEETINIIKDVVITSRDFILREKV